MNDISLLLIVKIFNTKLTQLIAIHLLFYKIQRY